MSHWIPHIFCLKKCPRSILPKSPPRRRYGCPPGAHGAGPSRGPKSPKNGPHQVQGVWWLLFRFLRLHPPLNGPQGPFCRKRGQKNSFKLCRNSLFTFLPVTAPDVHVLSLEGQNFENLRGEYLEPGAELPKNFGDQKDQNFPHARSAR